MKSLFSLALILGADVVQGHGKGHGFLHRRAQTTSAEALPSPDKPTLTGTISNCNQWYDVVEGDSCWSIAQNFGITQKQFEAWNSAVGDSCVVQIGVSYCVGVGEVVSTTTSKSSSRTGSSTASSITSASNSTITSTATSTTPYSTLSYNTTTNPVTITDSTWPPSQTQSGQPDSCKRL